ncbi:MAG: hypothetical protein JWR68_3448 [Polaromonas sp.]|nr:hypothetical protein [Polaromonas sp.]
MNVALRQRIRLPLKVWRAAFAACALAVLVLALIPGEVTISGTGWDKTNHLLAFSVLAVLGLQAYPGRLVVVLMGLLVYGGLIEILQFFTPDRAAEWTDLVADSVGLGLGCGVHRLAKVLVRQ